jgi:hypothetical protein
LASGIHFAGKNRPFALAEANGAHADPLMPLLRIHGETINPS